MSILRIGLLIALVIIVLPEDEQQRARLYDRAATAAHWTITFCERNEPTCDRAGRLWNALLKKAEVGAQMAYDFTIKYAKGTGRETGTAARGTLTPEDMRPAWRGRPTRAGA